MFIWKPDNISVQIETKPHTVHVEMFQNAKWEVVDSTVFYLFLQPAAASFTKLRHSDMNESAWDVSAGVRLLKSHFKYVETRRYKKWEHLVV